MGVGILFDETALNKYKMLNGQQRKTYKDLLIFPLRDFLSYPDAETSVNYELCSRNAAISCFPQLKLIAWLLHYLGLMIPPSWKGGFFI